MLVSEISQNLLLWINILSILSSAIKNFFETQNIYFEKFVVFLGLSLNQTSEISSISKQP